MSKLTKTDPHCDSPACRAAPDETASSNESCCARALAEGAVFCPDCSKRVAGPDPLTSPRAEAEAGLGSSVAAPVTERAIDPDQKRVTPKAPLVHAVPPVSAPPACRCGTVLPPGAHFCHMCAAPAMVAAPYRITCVPNGQTVQTLAKGATITIGKSRECDCVVPDDEYVSRCHARLIEAHGFAFIQDESTNGTFVRVKRPMRVFAGDEILVGTTLLRIEV